MKRSAENILTNQIMGIVAGTKRFASTDSLYELTPVIAGIRLLFDNKGDGSLYKELNLGRVQILSTLIQLSGLPKSDSVVSSFTGMTISRKGMYASTSTSMYRKFVLMDEWWEGEFQAMI
jgi:hypothetical protein